MKRILKTLVALLVAPSAALVAATGTSRAADTLERPLNLLFIIIGQQRCEAMGCAGKSANALC